MSVSPGEVRQVLRAVHRQAVVNELEVISCQRWRGRGRSQVKGNLIANRHFQVADSRSCHHIQACNLLAVLTLIHLPLNPQV